MLNRFTLILKMSALTLTLITIGCSTRQRQIEVTKPKPSTTPAIGAEPEWRPSDDGYASVVTEIPESELVKYMDPKAKLEFKFSYAGIEKAGPIIFANGKARIEITELPTSQTSKMVMQLLENSVVKLEGSKENVTLKAGPNSEALSLKVVPETKPETNPNAKPDKPSVKPDTPNAQPGVTPEPQPDTAELVISLEIESE